MASRKPANRSTSGTRQGPVRPGSPTARPASSRQGSAKKPATGANSAASGRSASPRNGTAGNGTAGNGTAGDGTAGNGTGGNSATVKGTAAAKPAAQRAASSGSGARGASRTGAMAQGRTAAVAELTAGGPVRRLLRAVWSPFRAMGGLPLATLVLSLYGLGASIYLTLAHYDTAVTLVCSDKGLVNCEEVTTSPESMIFGVIPVALAGLLFYIFMVAINSPWGWRLQRLPLVRWLRFGSVVAGMAFVLYLIYAELIEIRAICLWCTSVHVATFLIFALLVFHYVFSWESPAASSQD